MRKYMDYYIHRDFRTLKRSITDDSTNPSRESQTDSVTLELEMLQNFKIASQNTVQQFTEESAKFQDTFRELSNRLEKIYDIESQPSQIYNVVFENRYLLERLSKRLDEENDGTTAFQ